MVLITTVLVTMPWLIDTAECAVVTDGLISYWTFDNADIDGFTVNDVWGESHGTFVGPAGIVDGGKFGNALDPIPGHVEFDDSNLPAGNDPRTLSAWVNLDSVPEACGSVFQYGSGGDTLLLGIMVGTLATLYMVGWLADVKSDGTMPTGEWNHLTITYDGELLRIYINRHLSKITPVVLRLPLHWHVERIAMGKYGVMEYQGMRISGYLLLLQHPKLPIPPLLVCYVPSVSQRLGDLIRKDV